MFLLTFTLHASLPFSPFAKWHGMDSFAVYDEFVGLVIRDDQPGLYAEKVHRFCDSLQLPIQVVLVELKTNLDDFRLFLFPEYNKVTFFLLSKVVNPAVKPSQVQEYHVLENPAFIFVK